MKIVDSKNFKRERDLDKIKNGNAGPYTKVRTNALTKAASETDDLDRLVSKINASQVYYVETRTSRIFQMLTAAVPFYFADKAVRKVLATGFQKLMSSETLKVISQLEVKYGERVAQMIASDILKDAIKSTAGQITRATLLSAQAAVEAIAAPLMIIGAIGMVYDIWDPRHFRDMPTQDQINAFVEANKREDIMIMAKYNHVIDPTLEIYPDFYLSSDMFSGKDFLKKKNEYRIEYYNAMLGEANVKGEIVNAMPDRSGEKNKTNEILSPLDNEKFINYHEMGVDRRVDQAISNEKKKFNSVVGPVAIVVGYLGVLGILKSRFERGPRRRRRR